MSDIKQIYDSFIQNSVRLSKSVDFLQLMATEYVFKELPIKTVTKLLKINPDLPTPFFNEEILKNEEVLYQTIKTLTLMEASDTLNDFKSLNKKRKDRIDPPKKEEPLEGFAKILKGIASVPKPSDKELKKQREE